MSPIAEWMSVHLTAWQSAIPLALAALALVAGAAMAARRLRRQERRVEQVQILLREREERLGLALWGSGDEYWELDVPGWILMRSRYDAVAGKNSVSSGATEDWLTHVHPDDASLLRDRMAAHLEGRADFFESEHRVHCAGSWRWIFARGRALARDSDGAVIRVSGTSRDVTARRAAELDQQIARQVLHGMEEAVIVFDLAFRVTSVNPGFVRMTGWQQDDIVAQSLQTLASGAEGSKRLEEVRAALVRFGCWNGELRPRKSDGNVFACWAQMQEVRSAGGARTHYLGVMSDLSERKRTEERLRYLASYDLLTSLPNRSFVTERLQKAMREQRIGKIGVLYLDLDRFKYVNDTFGHASGDTLLKLVASRLRGVVSRRDVVARLGGDEFTIVLLDLDHAEEASLVAERLLNAFAEPFDLGDETAVSITPSIGISIYPDHGDDVAELLKYADTAMYQSKDRGRNTMMVYAESMDVSARERAVMIAALRKALERNEFRLVFQPRLSMAQWRVTAVEALLRWRSADIGEIPPSRFIPVAEDTGLIVEIGDWVLRESLAQMARWRSEGIRGITVSINVSMRQLQRGNLVGRLSALLEEHSVPPDQVELELTESLLMANAEQAIDSLRQLQAIGIVLSIDDFGTGYSSLSYLKRLPIDTLKIDQSFVGDLETDDDSRAITTTIIAMAQSLGVNVVAEGVETSAQVEFLRTHHCDEIQGFWISPPLSPALCVAFLREHASRRSAVLCKEPIGHNMALGDMEASINAIADTLLDVSARDVVRNARPRAVS